MLKSIVLMLASAALVPAKTVSYDWSIGWVTAAPDGFTRPVIGINGAWPCPPIEATVGDLVVVNVVNNLGNETTSIHFHGINQKGTPMMDGPSGVSQCPIPPGSSFTYSFTVDAPGSYWYHSHNMGQYPDGFRGAMVVQDPLDPYAGQYDEEFVMTYSDWYHDQTPVLIPQMLNANNPHGLPPFPEAILLNDGAGASYNFVPGKTYKIRIISLSAFAAALIQFDSHTMRIIEIDGTYVQKHDAYQIRVAPGQRYTILLNAQSAARRNYPFLLSLDMNRDFKNDPSPVYPFNATGYLMYDTNKPLPGPYVVPSWSPQDDATLVALDNQPLLGKPDQTIILDFNFNLDNLGIPRAYFNNITYVGQKVPTLYTAITTGTSNTDPTIYGVVNPFVLKKGQIIEIQINNLDAAIHPFHLHGHQFQVCERPSSGKGVYHGAGRNFPLIPPRRDVLAVNANSYAVLRFVADNPGIQLFHCHIEWHVEMGLTATFIESPEDLRGLTIPADHLAACQAQNIPTAGNAAGNTVNVHNLTGANTTPLNPNNGAVYVA